MLNSGLPECEIVQWECEYEVVEKIHTTETAVTIISRTRSPNLSRHVDFPPGRIPTATKKATTHDVILFLNILSQPRAPKKWACWIPLYFLVPGNFQPSLFALLYHNFMDLLIFFYAYSIIWQPPKEPVAKEPVYWNDFTLWYTATWYSPCGQK